MNDYCKLSEKGSLTAKPRSIYFSDLSFSPPHTPKYLVPNKSAYKPHHDPFFAEEEGAPGEWFGVILSMNCSSASQQFRAQERGHGPPDATLQPAVRRAFFMSKSSSSSVTEGYRRLHDTADEDYGIWKGEADQVVPCPDPLEPVVATHYRPPFRSQGLHK